MGCLCDGMFPCAGGGGSGGGKEEHEGSGGGLETHRGQWVKPDALSLFPLFSSPAISDPKTREISFQIHSISHFEFELGRFERKPKKKKEERSQAT